MARGSDPTPWPYVRRALRAPDPRLSTLTSYSPAHSPSLCAAELAPAYASVAAGELPRQSRLRWIVLPETSTNAISGAPAVVLRWTSTLPPMRLSDPKTASDRLPPVALL